ncbi:MAG: hypothetical protein MI924_13665 [Chloroflexales bacterium]|nr:hypothetical protein [Chloroflexales bacterium]
MLNNKLPTLYCLVVFILLTGCGGASHTPDTTSAIVAPVPRSTNSASPSPTTASSSTQAALGSPSPASMPQPVDMLPLDSEWRLNRQQSGECGYIVEAHNQTAGSGRLTADLRGYIKRPAAPPLLITCADSPHNLFLVDSLNKTKTRLRIDLPSDWQVRSSEFVLSPDQTEIAFATFQQSDSGQVARQIWVAQLQSGTTRRLLDIPQVMNNSTLTWDSVWPVAWRTDEFFFHTQLSGSHVLWRAVWNGSEVRMLEVLTIELGESAVFDYTISTTNPWIAYRKGDINYKTPVELRLLNTVTGEDRLIESGRGYDAFAFSQDSKYLVYRRTSQPQTEYAQSDTILYEELVQYNIASDAITVVSSNQINPRNEFPSINVSFLSHSNEVIYQPK